MVDTSYFQRQVILKRPTTYDGGGVDGETRWNEIVKFSGMALRELFFWAHNIVEMATRRKPMVLPRFEDLEIK